MSELNFETCAQLVVDEATIDKAFKMGDFSDADPETTFYMLSMTDFISAGDADSSFEEDETLEGQEYANSECRAEYDDNAIAETQKGFCCQAIAADGSVMGAITSATELSGEVGEAFALGGVEITYGAELFGSARGLGASLAAIASAALVFAQ